MARVTELEVNIILGNDEPKNVAPFITVANLMVDRHLVNKGMDEVTLREVEKWLAAHFASIRDPRIRERGIDGAREKYALSGGYSGGLDATPYGQQAMVLDYTGTLSSQAAKKAVIIDAVEEDYT